MKKNKRNGIISLWKFIFSLTIVCYHTKILFESSSESIFQSGYLAVEFFFIVSGYYFAKKTLKKNTEDEREEVGLYKIIIKSLKSLIPYLFTSYIIIMATLTYFDSFTKAELLNSIWYPLLLRQFGFQTLNVTNQLWYLTVLYSSYILLYPLLKKYKEKFIYYVSPLIVLFGYGMLFKNYGGLGSPYGIWTGPVFLGTIRGIIDINLGLIVYSFLKSTKDIEYTKIGKVSLTLISELLFIITIIFMYKLPYGKFDYVMLLMITIATTIALSGKTCELKLLSNKFFYYLEKISIPLYINHIAILTIIRYLKITKISPSIQTLLILIISLLFSILEYELIDYIKKKKILNKIKEIFVK